MEHKSQDPNFLEAGQYFVSAAALKKKSQKQKQNWLNRHKWAFPPNCI